MTDDIRPVLFDRHNADEAYRRDLGDTKRFIERFYADDVFREALAQDPVATGRRYGLRRDAEEIRVLWDPEQMRQLREGPGELKERVAALPLSVRRHLAFAKEKALSRGRYREMGTPTDPRFANWRARMTARCSSQLGGLKSDHLVQAPVCFELSKGCSVGCWFCSVAAPRLSDQTFPYTAANRSFWRETLGVFADRLGPAAGKGFCYWASDPLDNPDYEAYLVDFHELLGQFPQTTTAQAQKHVERVKALLRLAESKGGYIDRFSVLTKAQWNQIHEGFQPEDLTFVECIAQNKEVYGGESKSISGRALERHLKRVANNQEPPRPFDDTSTTACVSGFLVNMLDRSVRLITPCHASPRWPLGYWVVDSGTFSDAAGLNALLTRMIEDNMPTGLDLEAEVRLRPDLSVRRLEDGFELENRIHRHTLRRGALTAHLAESLQRGAQPRRLAFELAERGLPLEESYLLFHELYEGGLLDEEPEGAQNALGEWIPAPLQPTTIRA